MEEEMAPSLTTAERLRRVIKNERRKPIDALHQKAPASFPLAKLCRISRRLKISEQDYLAAMSELIGEGKLVLSGQMADHRWGKVTRRLVVITKDQVPGWFRYDRNYYHVGEDGEEFNRTKFQQHLNRMKSYQKKEEVRKKYCFVSLNNLRVSILADGLTKTIQAAYDRGYGPDGLNHELRTLKPATP